jgi:hypothetical protein
MPDDDQIYYRHAGSLPLVQRISDAARARIYQDFIDIMRPAKGDRILDIGVSDVITAEANLLEKRYPHQGDITCAGLGDGAAVRQAYPLADYVQILPNAPLPFASQQFSIATCNAVLEHLGGAEQRRHLVAEMLRVARFVFVSVPNRWFPVEHHTSLPLIHYVPQAFYRFCALTPLTYWSNPDNVQFLSKSDLERAWSAPDAVEVRYSGLRGGVFSSNLIAHNKLDR